jgi:hypothetical protein
MLLHLWPLLADPARGDRRLAELVRLAAMAAFLRPGRSAILVFASSVALLLATILFAALVLLAVVLVACLGCRWVLPATDDLEPAVLTARRAPPTA